MKWTTKDMPDQTGRTAIVTGANTGIGFETAKALAKAGAEVTLACRNSQKGQNAVDRILAESTGATVHLGALDLSSLASVRTFAEVSRTRLYTLDLLINNAGVMMPPSRETTEEGFELQFGTNHLGHFALTGLLWDLMVSQEGARVVTVSSTAHKMGQMDFDDPNWEVRPYKRMPSYGQSKLANLLFNLELNRRVERAGKGPQGLAAHPGWTATDLQRHSGLFRALNPIFAMRPWQGALPTLYAATAREAKRGQFFGPHGFLEARGYPTQVSPTEAAQNVKDAQRLWEMSEEMTGVSFGGATPD